MGGFGIGIFERLKGFSKDIMQISEEKYFI